MFKTLAIIIIINNLLFLNKLARQSNVSLLLVGGRLRLKKRVAWIFDSFEVVNTLPNPSWWQVLMPK